MTILQHLYLLFFGNNSSVYVNIFILSIFGFSIYRIWIAWLKVKAENKKYEELEIYCKDSTKEIEPLRLIDIAGKYGILHKRLEEIQKAFMRGQKITPELVESINDKIPFPSADSTKRVAASMVLLGLFGTLVGLSASILPMQNSLDESLSNLGSQSFQPIIYSMKAIISGIETAFSATILGVLTTLGLLFLIFLFERKKNTLEDAFELLVLTKILPIYNPAEKEESTTSLINSVKDNTSILRVLGDNTIRIGEDAKQQYELLVDSIAALTKSIAVIQEPFKEGNKVQQQMLSIVDGFTGTIADLKDTMGSMHEAISQFLDGNRETLETVKKTVELVESQRIEHNNLINMTSSLINKLGINTEQLIMLSPVIAGSMKGMEDLSVEIASTSERNIRQFKEIHETALEKIVTSLDSVMIKGTDQLENTSNKFYAELINAIDRVKSELKTDINGFEETFEQKKIFLQEENNKLFETVNTSLGTIAASFENLTNSTVESVKAVMSDDYLRFYNLIEESRKSQEEINRRQKEEMAKIVNSASRNQNVTLSNNEGSWKIPAGTRNRTNNGGNGGSRYAAGMENNIDVIPSVNKGMSTIESKFSEKADEKKSDGVRINVHGDIEQEENSEGKVVVEKETKGEKYIWQRILHPFKKRGSE